MHQGKTPFFSRTFLSFKSTKKHMFAENLMLPTRIDPYYILKVMIRRWNCYINFSHQRISILNYYQVKEAARKEYRDLRDDFEICFISSPKYPFIFFFTADGQTLYNIYYCSRCEKVYIKSGGNYADHSDCHTLY